VDEAEPGDDAGPEDGFEVGVVSGEVTADPVEGPVVASDEDPSLPQAASRATASRAGASRERGWRDGIGSPGRSGAGFVAGGSMSR
jgi:hypothetical protein